MKLELRTRTGVLLLLFIGFLVYFVSLTNGFILGDDTDQILENPQIRSLKNIPSFFTGSTYYRPESNRMYGLYYKPVMMIAYTFIYQIAGTDPLVYHLLQLVIHISNAVLLFFLWQRFFARPLAWVLALIFLLHPANTETVVWAAALQDTLYLFFGLTALLLIMHAKEKITLRRWLMFTGALLLSVFAKETGVVFVFIICLYVYVWRRNDLKKIMQLGMAVFLTYCLFRFGLARIGFGEDAISRVSRADFMTRMLNLPLILVRYFKLFIFPWHLETHQNWLVSQFSITLVLLPLILLVGILSGLVWLGKLCYRRKRNWFTLIFFVSWVTLGLLPHLQLIALDETFAERWLYLALVGLLGIGGVIVSTGQRYFKNKYGPIILIVFLLLLTGRTFVRTLNWNNSETLFTHDLQTAESNYYLENLYASLLITEGKIDEAAPYIEKSLAEYRFLSNLQNMAIVRMKRGQLTEADAFFSESLINKHNYPAVQNYANFLLFVSDDTEKANVVAQKYLTEYPEAPYLWMVAAIAHFAASQASSYANTPIIEKVATAISDGKVPDVGNMLEY